MFRAPRPWRAGPNPANCSVQRLNCQALSDPVQYCRLSDGRTEVTADSQAGLRGAGLPSITKTDAVEARSSLLHASEADHSRQKTLLKSRASDPSDPDPSFRSVLPNGGTAGPLRLASTSTAAQPHAWQTWLPAYDCLQQLVPTPYEAGPCNRHNKHGCTPRGGSVTVHADSVMHAYGLISSKSCSLHLRAPRHSNCAIARTDYRMVRAELRSWAQPHTRCRLHVAGPNADRRNMRSAHQGQSW